VARHWTPSVNLMSSQIWIPYLYAVLFFQMWSNQIICLQCFDAVGWASVL